MLSGTTPNSEILAVFSDQINRELDTDPLNKDLNLLYDALLLEQLGFIAGAHRLYHLIYHPIAKLRLLTPVNLPPPDATAILEPPASKKNNSHSRLNYMEAPYDLLQYMYCYYINNDNLLSRGDLIENLPLSRYKIDALLSILRKEECIVRLSSHRNLLYKITQKGLEKLQEKMSGLFFSYEPPVEKKTLTAPPPPLTYAWVRTPTENTLARDAPAEPAVAAAPPKMKLSYILN